MTPFKIFVLSMLTLIPVNQATAEACRLDHASYLESRSGAKIQFRPKDKKVDAELTTALFQLRLPNVSEVFEGDITWNAGSNTRPDGEIHQTCSTDMDADDGGCWLWTGNVYNLANGEAGLIDDTDMTAPTAILFADFGRSLATNETFLKANPALAAFDVFKLEACSS